MEYNKLIVAGIGTDVGKTVVSAILCEAFSYDYWKPIQAGDLQNSDSLKVGRLISSPQITIHPEAVKLKTPMSPHAAAEIDQTYIDSSQLQHPDSNNLIIELAGGLMVPINEDYLNIDWIVESKLPVVLVSNYYLGSINHTLLSLEILKNKNVPVIGLVFNGKKNHSTFDVILHNCDVPCILEVDQEAEVNQEVILRYATRVTI